MPTPNPSLTAKKQNALHLFRGGRFLEALSMYQDICKTDPLDADAWYLLGIIHGELGSLAQAEECSRQATRLAPTAHSPWDNLGIALMLQGKREEAQRCFLRAIELNSGDEQAHNNLGTLLRDEGKLNEAAAAYRRAIQLKPDYAEAHNNMGNLLHDLSQLQDALTYYETAARLNPGYVDARYNIGMVQQKRGLYDEALNSYRAVLAVAPEHAPAIAGIANLHEKKSEYQQAYDILKPLADRGGMSVPGALTMAAAARRLGHHEESIAIMEQLVALEGLSLQHKQELHFSLGNLYDDTAQYDQAFKHYFKGNNLRPYPDEPGSRPAYFAKLIETFSGAAMPKLARATNESERPLFIVGMPRTGTTLVEQILSNHPQVHGGGELRDIGDLIPTMISLTNGNAPFPSCVAAMTPANMDLLAQRYLDKLQELSADALHVTNKLPHNFLNLGFIALLFPNARVIHCSREPLDTCLSIYFHNFNATHPYASDLAKLGGYYRQYQRLMRHWESVLDIPIYHARYEEMVADQDSATRRLLEFCKLPWDSNCLRFYESKRVVTTPSYHQVRRPMYQTSIERWKHYQSHIAPLIEALAADD